MTITIRPATARDIPAIGSLAEATDLFPADMLDDMIAGYLSEEAPDIWFVAEDAAPIAPEALSIAPEDLMAARLSFAPAAQIIRSPYPIHGIWAMQRGGAKPPAEAQDILISRAGFDPDCDLLLPGAADFLSELMAGATMGEALDASPGLDPATGLGPTLALSLQRGIFTRLS